jgi:hypothetical protein
MGLRCLLGHDFTVPEVERERETDGNEVVVTVREVKTCRRCGERQIVSENKEVTTVEHTTVADAAPGSETGTGTDAGGGKDTDASRTDDPAAPFAGGDDPDVGVADEGATVESAGPEAGAAAGGPGDDDTAATDAPTVDMSADEGSDATGLDAGAEPTEPVDEAARDPETDDGVILDDEESADRGRGEWPDAPDVRDGDAAPGSDADPAVDDDTTAGEVVTDDGPDTPSSTASTADDDGGTVTDDAEFIDDDSGDTSGWPTHESVGGDGDRSNGTTGLDPTASDPHGANGGGDEPTTAPAGDGQTDAVAWPEHTGEDEGFDAQTAEAGGPDVSFSGGLAPHDSPDREYVGHERETTDDAEFVTDDSPTADDGPTEFYCPNCDHAALAGGTSMRPGDICPECRQGYVSERGA